MSKLLFVVISLLCALSAIAQMNEKHLEVQETLKDYIRENHVSEIEDMVHQFASSKVFQEFLLEKGHHIDPETADISRRDVRVGEDLDVFVKHLTEHQNFTMILVPLDIYSQMIYDTLLFSVLEVSDEWLKSTYPYHDLSSDEEKQRLLGLQNHDMLARHMYDQARQAQRLVVGEVEVKLHESYISSGSIHMHMSELSRSERKQLKESWSLFKKVFAHDINLNVEMNIYIFGSGDMRVLYYANGKENEFRITPNNIFRRHDFLKE